MPKIVSLAINRPTVSDVHRSLLSAPKFLASLGIDGDNFEEVTAAIVKVMNSRIGRGHYAQAFILPNGLVLKVTDDPDDASAAELIRLANAAGEYPVGLPHIWDVKRFRDPVRENETDADETRFLYAVVYEIARPLKGSFLTFEQANLRQLLSRMTRDNVWSVSDAMKTYHGESYPVLHRMVERVMRDPVFRTKLDEVLQGVRWLNDRGFEVRDLHAGNFGEASGGRTVLFDFGHGSRTRTGGNAVDEVGIVVAQNPVKKPAIPQAQAAFDECFDALVEQFPDFGSLELHQDEKAGSDNGAGSERQFGYCMDSKPIRIAFASKIEKLPRENIRGLMRHEFGHALDYRYGKSLGKMLGRRLPDGVERRADAIAESVFGEPIEYDERLIQCIDCGGASPRPRRLPR